ncbi:hypothetical protein TNCT_236651 [Trichonephila clavata]|uniref:Uncharacterized protein n=1 Tax=Trichonephila clavata TaxID=2740835 RepID=A0A8X6JPN8_TRICU|nr:hypothetical protein TNCT_236651 [Trichonephila clavata]
MVACFQALEMYCKRWHSFIVLVRFAMVLIGKDFNGTFFFGSFQELSCYLGPDYISNLGEVRRVDCNCLGSVSLLGSDGQYGRHRMGWDFSLFKDSSKVSIKRLFFSRLL